MRRKKLAEASTDMRRIAARLPAVLEEALDDTGWVALDEAQANASGRLLQKRSGALLRSIRYLVKLRKGGGELRLRAGGSRVPYARIQDEGGTIQGAPWLRFQIRPGDWRTVRQVRIRPTGYLRSAMDEASAQFPALLNRRLGPLLEADDR